MTTPKKDAIDRMKAKRNASLFVETLNVCCPHCGMPQPSPGDGTDAWTPTSMKENLGPKTCTECDEKFMLMDQSSAAIVA